jgi:hypothetical protein
MKKNIILLIISVLLFTCCATSLKNIDIKKIYFWLADAETRQITKTVIPGKLYILVAVVRAMGGEDFYNLNMNDFSFSSPDQSLRIIKIGSARYVRVRPDSFVFIKNPRVALKADVRANSYTETFFWPIDWKHYTTLDFSPDAEASSAALSDTESASLINDRNLRRKDGKDVDFECAYYEGTHGETVETYIVLYERNLKLLYALQAAKKINVKTNGRDGEDGEDGEKGTKDHKDGKDGKDGKNGGNAGNITITYYTDSDVNRFITLQANGGAGGAGGQGGAGYEDGAAGRKGRQGSSGRDGQVNEYQEHSFLDMFNVTGYPEFDRQRLRFYF